MKIAIDVSPLSSGHKVRGVGFYLANLLAALQKYHPEHAYLEFTGNHIPKNADLVHYPYFDPFFLSLPFFSSKPVVVTVHDLTPFILPQLFPVGLKGNLAWLLQKKRLQGAARIITDSLSSKKDIERLTGINESKIDVAYLAAAEHFTVISDKNMLSKIAKKYRLPKVFSLYVGDVTPNKNLVRLVKASLQTHPPLFMVGKALTDNTVPLDNPWTKDLAEVRSLAEKNQGKINLLGFIPGDDLVALYNLATVFVMPSLYEGFGLPVLEAMACGCPVITSDRGSLKEIGLGAYVVDPENIDSIAKGLREVMGNTKLRKKLRENGLLEAKKFSWQKTADKTVLSYQKVLPS